MESTTTAKMTMPVTLITWSTRRNVGTTHAPRATATINSAVAPRTAGRRRTVGGRGLTSSTPRQVEVSSV